VEGHNNMQDIKVFNEIKTGKGTDTIRI